MDLHNGTGATQRSRADAPLITPPFESVWPDVERRLRALLFRRGLDSPSADDIVQEVALRALAHHVTYASAADLLRWAAPVACNLHVDLVRHRARVLDDPGATERPATVDVAREVAHRIELQRAFRGIAKLRPADREALIDAVAAEPVVPRSRQEAVRLAVRRHRARNRLAVVLEQLAAWAAAARLLARPRRFAALALVPAAVAVPLLVQAGLPHHRSIDLAPERVAPAAMYPPDAAAWLRTAADAARPTAARRAARTAAAHHRAGTPGAASTGPSTEQHVSVTAPGTDIHAKAGREPRPPGQHHVFCLTGVPSLDRDVCL
jgi:DNA-directed RNA polymerase specialized sigma24 family protein